MRPENDDEDEHEGSEDTNGAKTSKRRNRTGVATLESNPDNLNLKDLEYQISTDPLFQKTSASFDEGGAKGMLLNHLNVQNGCQVVFDSSDAVDAMAGTEKANDDEEEDDDDAIDLGEMAGDLKNVLQSIGSAELTPGFTAFRLSRSEGSDISAQHSLVIGVPRPRTQHIYELSLFLCVEA